MSGLITAWTEAITCESFAPFTVILSLQCGGCEGCNVQGVVEGTGGKASVAGFVKTGVEGEIQTAQHCFVVLVAFALIFTVSSVFPTETVLLKGGEQAIWGVAGRPIQRTSEAPCTRIKLLVVTILTEKVSTLR
jgi:hypothetical protein